MLIKNNLFQTAIVEKRNVLNEIRKNNMTLQELRFFSIYLSKINSRDISTRVVRFPLSDFQKIMGIGSDMNINHFREIIRKLLQQIVEVPNESGYGYTAFQLFKECTLEKDEYDEWYVEIDAHDKALPLMFEFKNRYFHYELWNALRLKSSNQLRMYEILKQYETLGKREISVTELRELLGLSKDEYSGRTGWSDFRKKVLDSCQQALQEYTDIRFSYEKGKSGTGGKWLTIIFHISKNDKYKNPISLEKFIDNQPESNVVDVCGCDEDACKEHLTSEFDKNYLRYASALDYQVNETELTELIALIDKLYPDYDDNQKYGCLNYSWHKLLRYDEKKKIKNKISYLMTMITNDFNEVQNNQKDKSKGEEIAKKYEIFTKML